MNPLLRITSNTTLVAVITLWPNAAAAQSRPVTGQSPAEAPHAGHPPPQDATPPAPSAEQHDPARDPPPRATLPPFIPTLTDEDRRAAFSDVSGHAVHDDVVNYFVLLDRFEWRAGSHASGLTWDTKGWIGKDADRFWFRFEGDGKDGGVESARTDALYGRAISPWWNVVAGVRQDARPGPPQTWAAVGVQGLAPYWFDVEATAYFGASGRTHFRMKVEYDLLFTNRLKLQPAAELDFYGTSDVERGVGAGLAETEFGLRVRYEIRREWAPYLGVTWTHKHGGTADAAREAGGDTSAMRLTAGMRVWF